MADEAQLESDLPALFPTCSNATLAALMTLGIIPNLTAAATSRAATARTKSTLLVGSEYGLYGLDGTDGTDGGEVNGGGRRLHDASSPPDQLSPQVNATANAIVMAASNLNVIEGLISHGQLGLGDLAASVPSPRVAWL